MLFILMITIVFGEDKLIHVKQLNNSEFHLQNVGRDNHSWFILFYRPTCPHCQKFIPTWDKLGEVEQNYTKIAAINCNEEKELSKLFSINAVPTMILISTNGNLHHYSGDRTLNSLQQFLEQNWQNNSSETPSEILDQDPTWIIFVLLGVLCVSLIWIFKQEKESSYNAVHGSEIELHNQQIEI